MPIAGIIIAVIALAGIGVWFVSSNDTTTVTETAPTEMARVDSETPTDSTADTTTTEGDTDDGSMMGGDSMMSDESMMAEADMPEADTMMEGSMMTDSSMPDDVTAAATPYSSVQTYLTPARTSHEIDVTLSVADDGTIVGANVTYDDGDGYSNPHQERFDNAYQEEIIGQNISEAELAITGGASLTTGAFNEALAEVRSQQS